MARVSSRVPVAAMLRNFAAAAAAESEKASLFNIKGAYASGSVSRFSTKLGY
jgi:hypothetical protein